jgi:hypothetical protein
MVETHRQVVHAPQRVGMLTQLAELREDSLDQQVALRVHIAERGRHEDADLSLL